MQEAVVCEAGFPWKQVTAFPYDFFETKPAGEAVVFHLDGRGSGVVQSMGEDSAPHPGNSEELAKFWVNNFVESDGLLLTSQWLSSEGVIDGIRSVDRKVTVEKDGRTMILRGSFVSTRRGDLMVYSLLNKKIDSQVGEYLHRNLIASVSLR